MTSQGLVRSIIQRLGAMDPDLEIIRIIGRDEIIVLSVDGIGVYESLEDFDKDAGSPLAGYSYFIKE